MTAEAFFRLLQGAYSSFAELRARANKLALEHYEAFPLRFDMQEFLDWAYYVKQWIIRTDTELTVLVQ